MNKKGDKDANREYEEFEPTIETVPGAESTDTVMLHFPGFKGRYEVKVSYDNDKNIIWITGERPIGGKRWSRVNKEIQFPSEDDMRNAKPRYKNTILYLQYPKLVPTPPPKTEETEPQNPPAEPLTEDDEQVKPSPEAPESKKEEVTTDDHKNGAGKSDQVGSCTIL